MTPLRLARGLEYVLLDDEVDFDPGGRYDQLLFDIIRRGWSAPLREVSE